MRTFFIAFLVMIGCLIWWFCGNPQPTQAASAVEASDSSVSPKSDMAGSPLASMSCMQTLLSWHVCMTTSDCGSGQNCVTFDDPCHNANGRELEESYCVDQSQAELGACKIMPGANSSWHVACGTPG